MIIGHVKDKPIELVENGSTDPHESPFDWKFGSETVRTPGEAMDRIIRAAGESGLPASRLIDPAAVRKAQNDLIRHQREQLAAAYKQRVEAMENDPRCPPELLELERVEQKRVMDLLG